MHLGGVGVYLEALNKLIIQASLLAGLLASCQILEVHTNMPLSPTSSYCPRHVDDT